MRDLIVQLIRESIKDAKVYYHGRGGSRPFTGKYIYLTDNPHYAMGFSDDKIIKAYRLKIPSSSIFSIKDPQHRALLSANVDPQVMDSVLTASDGHELDWAAINNIANEEYELPEDLLISIGFRGIFLREREWADSLYVFDQKDVEFLKDINIDNKAFGSYRQKMDAKLFSKYNFI